jgi:hypothetical protein
MNPKRHRHCSSNNLGLIKKEGVVLNIFSSFPPYFVDKMMTASAFKFLIFEEPLLFYNG